MGYDPKGGYRGSVSCGRRFEVDWTIENVNISYDSIIIDDAAGILLKGNAKLNLTVKGDNSLKGTYQISCCVPFLYLSKLFSKIKNI